MSDLVSTSELRDRVRRDTGFAAGSFATDVEIRDDLLRAAREFADELIQSGGEYQRSTATIATVSGQASYSLPADFYRMLAVHFTTTSGKVERAEKFEIYELEELLNQTTAVGSEFGRYRLGGANGATPTETIEWAPTPLFVRNFRIDYVPSPVFTIVGAEYNLRSNGPAWEEFLVSDVAARLVERQRLDASAFYARREAARARFKKRAPTRDASPTRPTRSRDFYGLSRPIWPWDRRRNY